MQILLFSAIALATVPGIMTEILFVVDRKVPRVDEIKAMILRWCWQDTTKLREAKQLQELLDLAQIPVTLEIWSHIAHQKLITYCIAEQTPWYFGVYQYLSDKRQGTDRKIRIQST